MHALHSMAQMTLEDAQDTGSKYSLLQELLEKPTDQSGSHLDLSLDFIASSPAHVPSLGKLGCCNHVLEQQVRERLQQHKHEVLAQLRKVLESKQWGHRVLSATLVVDLRGKDIGDLGAALLARWAQASGSVPNLKELKLWENHIGDAGMIEFSRVIASGSLRNLEKLWLNDNEFGNSGVSALAGAIANGSLDKLTFLNLNNNTIGDAGVSALARAIASGSLPALKSRNLSLSGNPGDRAPVREALARRMKSDERERN